MNYYYKKTGKSNEKNEKKVEFSKKWLISCIVLTAIFSAVSYILASCGKDPVVELSIKIVDIMWGTSGVSFVGYAIQNSVRAFTASKFGLPTKEKNKADE